MPLNLIVVEYISHWKKAILVWCWIALGFFLQQEKISILMLSLWFMVQNKPSILMWMMVVGVLWWCGEKGLCSVLFPSRHAPRKIRICEEQGSKGRLDSNPCQVVLAQYPWGLKSHDPFAWNIVLLLLILCRWIHNCIHVSEKSWCCCSCSYFPDGFRIISMFLKSDYHFLETLCCCCCCCCWYFADGSRIVSTFCRLNPQLYPRAWNLTTLLLETFCCCCCW